MGDKACLAQTHVHHEAIVCFEGERNACTQLLSPNGCHMETREVARRQMEHGKHESKAEAYMIYHNMS